jgi:eukaryotic-like serine/threonine-protein kinase
MGSADPSEAWPEGETQPPVELEIDRRIGPYRVLRELGHGGMGVVYLAARADDQYRKRVAIKVIPVGGTSYDAIRHFRRERQILASLEHPNIARLLDGGTTSDGAPYIVMEFVEGEAIDRYCHRHELALADRLRMFLVVCGAVAYAHRNLVVHRDLKPRNILVSGDGVPKLLDFGIATFLNPDLAGETAGPAAAFTAQYASPEQVQSLPVTTAADVYSLGVVLYELLTHRSPYRLKTRAPSEIFRAVCEQQPDLPSAAIHREPGTSPDADTPATSPSSEVFRLQRRLKGDLDTILMKALRKEPHQRYLSVEAFADDIGRFLDGKPVAARRPTLAYRTGKFLRRHWLPAAASAAVLVTLIAGAAVLALQAQRLERERDKSTRIAGFLTELFTVADPGRSRGSSVTAREILDEGVKKIDSTLADDPETRGELLGTMSEVYQGLGLSAESERLARQSLELRRATFGDASEITESGIVREAFALGRLGRVDEAVALLEPALARQQRTFGDEHLLTAAIKDRLGVSYTRLNRLDEAGAMLTDAVEVRTRLLGRGNETTLASLSNLAIWYQAKGRVDEAIALDREVLGLRRAGLGADHPMSILSLNNLAFRLGSLKRYDEARQLLQEGLTLAERTLGVSHPIYGTLVHSLGEIELSSGNLEAARQRLEHALRVYRLQPGHPDLGLLLYQLAEVAVRQSDSDKALDLLVEAVRARALGGDVKRLSRNPHLAPLLTHPRVEAVLANPAGPSSPPS